MAAKGGTLTRWFVDDIRKPATLALLATVLCVCYLLSVRFRRGLRNVPGPFLASITSLDRMQTAASGKQHRAHMAYHEKYGPLVRVGPNHVSISDPQYIPTIYGITSRFIKSNFYSVFDVTSDAGRIPTVFSIRDPQAHTQLKRPVAAAYAMTALLELEPMADECTRIFERKLDGFAAAGQAFDLGEWLQWYAFDVISSITFSNRFHFMEREEDVSGIIAAIEARLVYNSIVGQIPAWHPYLMGSKAGSRILSSSSLPALARLGAARFLAAFAAKQVQRYKANKGHHADSPYRDMLARFKRTRAGAAVMSENELLSHAASNMCGGPASSPAPACQATLLTVHHSLAGSDTTAISLRSLFYYLCKTPGCMQKVVDEIDAHDRQGRLSTCVTFAEGNQLTYFQACMREALRMHPAVGFLLERVVPPEGGHFGPGIDLPGGTIVGMNPWVLAYDKAVYGADADCYRPERWLEADAAAYKQMDRSYFAFGSGARTCMGKNVSLMEMSKLVPQLLRNFSFALADPDAEWQLHDFWFVKQVNLVFTVQRRIKKKEDAGRTRRV